MHSSSHIAIGFISKAHGIRGEVHVILNAEDAELLRGPVFLRRGRGEPLPRAVVGLRTHHGGLLARIEGVNDRTAAEALKGAEILVERAKLSLDENDDEILLADLVGLLVLREEDDGTVSELGRIESVDTPAGQELWSIRTPDGKEVLFPAVEEFVRDIDPEAGSVRIAPPPGLLDLYLGE